MMGASVSSRNPRDQSETTEKVPPAEKLCLVDGSIPILKARLTGTVQKQQLGVVLVWLTVFIAVALMQKNIRLAFQMESVVHESLVNQESSKVGGNTFLTVASVDDIWDWTEDIFRPFIHHTEWYNGDAFDNTTQGTVSYNNKVISGYRVLQKRVHDHTCAKSPRFEAYIPHCWGELDNSPEVDTPFGPASDPTRYRAEHHRGEAVYFVDFGDATAKTANDALWAQLKADRWIDLPTRWVAIEFTLFNHNINLFTSVQLAFKVLPSGLVKPRALIETFRVEPYLSTEDKIREGLEIFLCLVTILIIAHDWTAMFLLARKAGWGKIITLWSIMRQAHTALVLTCIGLWLKFLDSDERRSIVLPASGFLDLEVLNEGELVYETVLSITVLFFIIRILENLQWNAAVAFITRTMESAWPQLSSFLIVFFGVYVLFTISGMLAFGHATERWSEFRLAFSSAFELLTVEIGFEELYQVNPVAAVFFYYSFMILVYLILINMVIAILAESYLQLSAERRSTNRVRYQYTQMDDLIDDFNHLRERDTRFTTTDALTVLTYVQSNMSGSKHSDGVATYKDLVRACKDCGVHTAMAGHIMARVGLNRFEYSQYLLSLSNPSLRNDPVQLRLLQLAAQVGRISTHIGLAPPEVSKHLQGTGSDEDSSVDVSGLSSGIDSSNASSGSSSKSESTSSSS